VPSGGSGTTIDDAAGRGLRQGRAAARPRLPGRREIDRLAREGDPEAFDFPVRAVPGLDFSFSA
jgi:N6-L-threonylcarbamoyladenine synthase